MTDSLTFLVDSPMGKCETDRSGSPIGISRMDPDKSYCGIGSLLEVYINRNDETAWADIREKIDYTYENLHHALSSLDTETNFSDTIKSELERGRKLLFKPNLVNPQCIDPQTHQPGLGITACTEWPFMAALMRWFHDRIGIRYRQMAVGEAASLIPSIAARYSMLFGNGRRITPEAVIEGKSGDFYGGWGFYFVRKYLAQSLEPDDPDDPMSGHEESAAGAYIPMGKAGDKLMVYDLNRIHDEPAKGRDVEVPDGVNFKTITLHKAVIGGDPNIPEDIAENPGCVLVNVPRLKVHALAIITNAIKNLGIGLYPMQSTSAGEELWDYAILQKRVPGIKGRIPHEVWNAEMDERTGLPVMDPSGKVLVTKTGGLTGTMLDIIKAVRNQGIFMLHVVDAVETVNIDHQGVGMGKKVKEGLVFSALDMAALDLLCARYLFSNVPLKEAMEVVMEDGYGGFFPQKVPVPEVDGSRIVTREGYDSPISRDRVIATAVEEGLGRKEYYVVGRDAVTDSPMASLLGHLGTVREETFSDVTTETLYFDAFCFPWTMQKTCLSYFEAVDRLTGSSLKRDFLAAFDDDDDGEVTLEEFGKKGQNSLILHMGATVWTRAAEEPLGHLKGTFHMQSKTLKTADSKMNPQGYDFLAEWRFGPICLTAFMMSMAPESPDPFFPDMTYGKGKWPSFKLAKFMNVGSMLYGTGFPRRLTPSSMYGTVFRYADHSQIGGKYSGDLFDRPDPRCVSRYVTDMRSGTAKPLDFTLFVPPGFDRIGGKPLPNVEATRDPRKVFTASFEGGKESRPEETP